MVLQGVVPFGRAAGRGQPEVCSDPGCPVGFCALSPQPSWGAGVHQAAGTDLCWVSRCSSPQVDGRLLDTHLEVGDPQAASAACPELMTSELRAGCQSLRGSAAGLQCDGGTSLPFRLPVPLSTLLALPV